MELLPTPGCQIPHSHQSILPLMSSFVCLRKWHSLKGALGCSHTQTPAQNAWVGFPAPAHGSSFQPQQTLGCNSDGSSDLLAPHMGDSACIPGSWLCPAHSSLCRHLGHERVVGSCVIVLSSISQIQKTITKILSKINFKRNDGLLCSKPFHCAKPCHSHLKMALECWKSGEDFP